MTLGEKSKNIERIEKKSKLGDQQVLQKYWHAKIDIEENAYYTWKTWVKYVFYCINISFSVCQREKYLIVFYEKRL